MSKQTAVEWYENEISALIQKYENQEISKIDFILMKHNLFYPAKKMEREQIVDAWENGFMSTAEGWNGEVTPEMHNETLNTEQYYNKTYGSNK
jgi:hypothetical protein